MAYNSAAINAGMRRTLKFSTTINDPAVRIGKVEGADYYKFKIYTSKRYTEVEIINNKIINVANYRISNDNDNIQLKLSSGVLYYKEADNIGVITVYIELTNSAYTSYLDTNTTGITYDTYAPDTIIGVGSTGGQNQSLSTNVLKVDNIKIGNWNIAVGTENQISITHT